MGSRNTMKNYRVRILDKSACAKDSSLVTLEKPKCFSYTPGHYIFVGFPDTPSIKPLAFSLASAPSEPFLVIAMRDSHSPWKQAIKIAKIGQNLEISGPYGAFALHYHPKTPAVFLAGGIGITPFRSMIVEEKRKQFPHGIFLFYANRNFESAIFIDELSQLQHPQLQFIPIFEEPTSAIPSETGLICKEVIHKYIQDIFKPIYYIVGPPAMVDTVHQLMITMAVDNNHIYTEAFTGYS